MSSEEVKNTAELTSNEIKEVQNQIAEFPEFSEAGWLEVSEEVLASLNRRQILLGKDKNGKVMMFRIIDFLNADKNGKFKNKENTKLSSMLKKRFLKSLEHKLLEASSAEEILTRLNQDRLPSEKIKTLTQLKKLMEESLETKSQESLNLYEELEKVVRLYELKNEVEALKRGIDNTNQFELKKIYVQIYSKAGKEGDHIYKPDEKNIKSISIEELKSFKGIQLVSGSPFYKSKVLSKGSLEAIQPLEATQSNIREVVRSPFLPDAPKELTPEYINL